MNVNRGTEERQALPSGWRWVELGEVCYFRHGGTPSKTNPNYWSGAIPWVSPKDMKTDLIWDTKDHVTQDAINQSSACLVPAGAILIVVRSGILVHHFPVALTGQALSFNQDIKALLPKGAVVNPNYLFHILRAQESTILSDGIKKGATVHSVRSAYIEKLEIPLPPLAEQKRIAAILNEQMAAVEKARAAAEAQLEAAKALPAAYLSQVFPKEGQELSHGWRRGKLVEVCEFLDSQRVPVNESDRTKRIAGKPVSALYPYYGANGQVGWIDDYLFDEPLVLLAEDGGFFGSLERPIAYLISGKTWVNNHAHVLRPRSGIDIEFLWLMLAIRPDVGKLVTGNTRPKLNQDVAAHIPIVILPLVEQKRIAAVLRKQMASAERLRSDIEKQLYEINSLPAALLRKAFNGEL
ncbi:MAG: restriction endonuclease subunit S [Candidatus Atribacteria bacterium]|nr:restriction endonuclease subunit S [Candidatus Atribacteria bacterium]